MAAFRLIVWGLVAGAAVSFIAPAWGQGAEDVYRAKVLDVSKKVDQLIYARQKEAGVKAGEKAGDGTFFRRVNIDLIGRIPELFDIDNYLSDDSPDKQWPWVERMLAHERRAPHIASVFRFHMLGAPNQMTLGFQPGFEAFLRDRFEKNVGYDKIVHEILVSGAGGVDPRFGGFPGGPGAANSATAFFFANENKPENLAAATTRVFLGVKLECAQCHAHPFAKWTRDQFWEFAAFYSGRARFTPRLPVAGGMPAAPKPGEIEIPGTKKVVKARFLDGAVPPMGDADPQKVLADWVVSPKNPYFAKATVDFVWSNFFGVSLLEPILEPSDDSPITHPELLDLLANELLESKYDITHLIRVIVHTDAYQRASSGKDKLSREDYNLFVRMPVRGMTPEQLFDSVAEATAMKRPAGSAGMPSMAFGAPLDPPPEFLTKFVSQDRRHETQTSILQALYLMNGKFLNDRLDPSQNSSLEILLTQRTDNAKKIRLLYMVVLARQPRSEELTRLTRYLDEGGPTGDTRKALVDVYWALLNSGEFMLNH